MTTSERNWTAKTGLGHTEYVEMLEKECHRMGALCLHVTVNPQEDAFYERIEQKLDDEKMCLCGCGVSVGSARKHSRSLAIPIATLKERARIAKEFEQATIPARDFLRKYGNPHSLVTIELAGALFYSGELEQPFEVQD